MHSTSKEQYVFFCLLAAIAAFLLGIAVARYRSHEPVGSRVNWPAPAEFQR
jgi:hypothetical protein